MPLTGEWEPGTSDWARKQVEEFEASDGAKANTLRGVPIVIVTSVGAKSGKLRKNPVMCVEHDGEYAVVASKGGADKHPTWYYNLVQNPNVELQNGSERHDYVAHVAEGAERDVVAARSHRLAGLRELPEQDRPADPGVRADAC
ncbi:F420H(2)-dependent quinone reductase [Humibacter antri]